MGVIDTSPLEKRKDKKKENKRKGEQLTSFINMEENGVKNDFGLHTQTTVEQYRLR